MPADFIAGLDPIVLSLSIKENNDYLLPEIEDERVEKLYYINDYSKGLISKIKNTLIEKNNTLKIKINNIYSEY